MRQAITGPGPDPHESFLVTATGIISWRSPIAFASRTSPESYQGLLDRGKILLGWSFLRNRTESAHARIAHQVRLCELAAEAYHMIYTSISPEILSDVLPRVRFRIET